MQRVVKRSERLVKVRPDLVELHLVAFLGDADKRQFQFLKTARDRREHGSGFRPVYFRRRLSPTVSRGG